MWIRGFVWVREGVGEWDFLLLVFCGCWVGILRMGLKFFERLF